MTTNHQPQKRTVDVKPYTLAELAMIYGVDSRTLKKWILEFLSEVGEQKGRYYTIPQVKIIFENLCLPHTMEIE